MLTSRYIENILVKLNFNTKQGLFDKIYSNYFVLGAVVGAAVRPKDIRELKKSAF